MPNFPAETGIQNVPWERIRKAMCEVNRQRHIIRAAEKKITRATEEIGYVLWPRTDPEQQEPDGE